MSKPCANCGTELGGAVGMVEVNGGAQHWQDRCLAIVITQRDEATRHLANCLDTMNDIGLTSIAARAALEKLRGK